MNVQEPIKVVKIHLSKEKQASNPIDSFPKMPEMYLKLIENKDKIKPELVNKEYQPDLPTFDEPSITGPMSVKLDNLIRTKSKEEESVKNSVQNSDEDDNSSNFFESPGLSNSDIESSISKDVSSEESEYSEKYRQYSEKNRHRRPPSEGSSTRNTQTEPSNRDLDDKIMNHFKTNSNANQNSKYNWKGVVAPTLSELNVPQERVIPDAKYMQTDTKTDDMKRELLFKFDLLRKSYKNAHIPEFNMFSDYEDMKRSYDSTVKQLSIDTSIDSYKTYLIGGFMLVEFVLGNWFNFDMQGFTQQQITTMNSYDRLLIELGEKSYVDEESQWPVEVRLLGMIVMNAGFFIVSKMIMKKTGSNLMNMINSMNSFKPDNKPPPPQKRTMKRPNINLDNLPEL